MNAQPLDPPPQDMNLNCTVCGSVFTWTAAEQEFYSQHKFQPPKRCTDCRKQRRPQQRKPVQGVHTSSRERERA